MDLKTYNVWRDGEVVSQVFGKNKAEAMKKAVFLYGADWIERAE